MLSVCLPPCIEMSLLFAYAYTTPPLVARTSSTAVITKVTKEITEQCSTSGDNLYIYHNN